ncbi:MAG: C39 family peptidase, partial [Chloroflexi bacterium]|nr:C39 family peptidase [Chloroflexota bacterium]
MRKRTNRIAKIMLGLVVLILLSVALSFIPKIHAAIAWRVEDLQTQIYYFFNPPGQVVFVPTQQSQVTITPQPTSTPTPVTTAQFTPTITSTPVPLTVILDGVIFVDQMNRWNYCGPANLTMALKYMGWTGTRDEVGATIKPGVDDPSLDAIQRSQTDVNVMPYEMVDFVNDKTLFRALFRYGGTLDLLRSLIAAGFPVIAEKGIYQTLRPENTMQWAGHYAFTTGYDDSTGEFIFQDSYTPNENIPYEQQGKNVRASYEEYLQGWRAFNYVFIVVYQPERESELYQVLGNWADESWAAQKALDTAEQETSALTGIDEFFAWFNKGSNYGLLTDYGQGALAYDQAFTLYNALPENDRPYRVMWYQTGPYKAYYYTSRYQDVINLADKTEATLFSHRVLEETLYWRALAEADLGYYDKAYEDMRSSLTAFSKRPSIGAPWLKPTSATTTKPTKICAKPSITIPASSPLWINWRNGVSPRNELMKLLHFADAHIDMANYGRHDPETGLPLRVLDFLKSLDAIIEAAIAEKVDLVIFAGDAYRDRTPAPTFQ